MAGKKNPAIHIPFVLRCRMIRKEQIFIFVPKPKLMVLALGIRITFLNYFLRYCSWSRDKLN